VFCLLGIAVALFAQGKGSKQSQQPNRSNRQQDAPGAQRPDVVQMIGPVTMNKDLRSIPYVPQTREREERRLTRYPFPLAGADAPAGSGRTSAYVRRLLKSLWRPTPTMPGPVLTFEGTGHLCGCQPSDSEGDVGPNHYVEGINESLQIFDKNGNTLAGPIRWNQFFAPLTGTPCGEGGNDGDPYVMYDAQADRWVVSDFAFPSFPGSSFYQCIAVSQSPDPVAGPWNFYALQVDPNNPTFMGDYPKFAIWDDGGTQNAYFLTMNLFSRSTSFQGVRVYALDRVSMLGGGPTNAIGFTLSATDVGASYSFIAATFREGDPPPSGTNDMVLAIDSPATGGVTLTQVHARFFHVDFVNPANAVFGLGPNHAPNAEITVDGFIDAFTNTTSDLVPQQGTSVTLDTLGDKIMTPVYYQNLAGTESLWADSTVCTEATCAQPTGVRWYQFDVTGNIFPATPVQQQTWTNNNDGLWRWMPSITVDQSGNTVIGYSASSTTAVPSIRYAGRLVNDPPSNLAEGEAVMFAGVGPQTSHSRWGDYTRTEVDPSNGMDFWHINQYVSGGEWHTRIGKFNFVGPQGTPTPTPTPTPIPTVQVTVQTSPATRAFSVDGTTYSSTQTFSWASGSSHTIATTSPQSGGTGVQYVWTRWSDSGAISHIVAPTTNKTYTATFRTQYYLTMTHDTGGTVSPASGWKNSGSTVSITATPIHNNQVSYSFAGWTGSGAGSYFGMNNPASITMNGPITENAAFTQNNVQVTVQTNPTGLAFSVDGPSYTTVQTFSWQPGSSHTIATTSPQSGGTGVQYLWMNWSGGGAISHTVAPTANTTYTATFGTQYYLTMSPATGGTVSPASGWKNSDSTVSITARPATNYTFTNWTGSGTGSYSGTNNPASITMGGPITETATFTHN